MIPGTLSVFQGLKVFQGCLKLATGPLVISYHRMLFRMFFVHRMFLEVSSRPPTPPRLRTLTSGRSDHVFFPAIDISVICFDHDGYDDWWDGDDKDDGCNHILTYRGGSSFNSWVLVSSWATSCLSTLWLIITLFVLLLISYNDQDFNNVSNQDVSFIWGNKQMIWMKPVKKTQSECYETGIKRALAILQNRNPHLSLTNDATPIRFGNRVLNNSRNVPTWTLARRE